MKIKLGIWFLLGSLTASAIHLIYCPKNKQIIVQQVVEPLVKQHKFHYNDDIVIIDGFYKGLSGTIVGYLEYTDEYSVLIQKDPLGPFEKGLFVKDTEIQIKNHLE